MIDEYFNEIEELLNNNPFIIKNEISKNKLNEYSGIIKGILRFKKSTLSFIEVTDLDNNTDRVKKKYKYHYMDDNNNLIFRYDNVKHYQNIKTFPNHKHTYSEIIETSEPSFKMVLKEIKEYLQNT